VTIQAKLQELEMAQTMGAEGAEGAEEPQPAPAA